MHVSLIPKGFFLLLSSLCLISIISFIQDEGDSRFCTSVMLLSIHSNPHYRWMVIKDPFELAILSRGNCMLCHSISNSNHILFFQFSQTVYTTILVVLLHGAIIIVFLMGMLKRLNISYFELLLFFPLWWMQVELLKNRVNIASGTPSRLAFHIGYITTIGPRIPVLGSCFC